MPKLTVDERAEHVAEWIRLCSGKGGQVAHPLGGNQPHSKGTSAAAKEFGLERTDIQRSLKIAGRSPEAKAAAREAGPSSLTNEG